ncbi:MAG: hypothetical protein WCK76_07595 [Elusimicrobiota bacterium]
MQDLKILIITSNAALSAAAAGAFAAARVQATGLPACRHFSARPDPGFLLVLLDLAVLGPDKIAELKAFLVLARGLSVIAMFEAGRTPDRVIVEILSAGADDAMSNATEIPLLVAKTKAHLRRLAAQEQADCDAGGLNRGSGI